MKDLWAWVLVDHAGDTIAAATRDNMFFPLVGDHARCLQLEPAAQAIADMTGRPVRLVQFLNRVDRKTLTPQENPHG